MALDTQAFVQKLLNELDDDVTDFSVFVADLYVTVTNNTSPAAGVWGVDPSFIEATIKALDGQRRQVTSLYATIGSYIKSGYYISSSEVNAVIELAEMIRQQIFTIEQMSIDYVAAIPAATLIFGPIVWVPERLGVVKTVHWWAPWDTYSIPDLTLMSGNPVYRGTGAASVGLGVQIEHMPPPDAPPRIDSMVEKYVPAPKPSFLNSSGILNLGPGGPGPGRAAEAPPGPGPPEAVDMSLWSPRQRSMAEKAPRTFADGTSPAAVAKLVDAMKGKGRGDENAFGFGRDGGSIFGGGRADGGMFSFAEHGPAPTVRGKGGGGRGADMFGMAEKFRRSGPDLGQGPSEITVKAPQKAPGGRGGGGPSTPRADPAKPNPNRDTGSGKSTNDVHPDRPDPHPSTSTTPAGPAPNPAPTKSGPTTADPTPAPAPVPAPADPPPTSSTSPAPTPTGTGGTGSGGTGSGAGTGTGKTSGSAGTGTGKAAGGGGGKEKPAPPPPPESPPPSKKPEGEDPRKKHGRPDDSGGSGGPRSKNDNPNPEDSGGGGNPRARDASSQYRPSDDSGGGGGRGGGPGGPRSYDAYPDPESSGGGNPRSRGEMPNPEDAVGPRGPSARLAGRTFGNWYGSGSGAL